MRSDRYTRVVLTVIAVALCVIALPRLETSEVMASSPRLAEAAIAAEPQQRTIPQLEEGGLGSVTARAPTSTKPLRWRVAWAALNSTIWDTYCSVSIVVTNVTASSVNVEVEWMAYSGSSLALKPSTLAAHGSKVWIANPTSDVINNVPWYAQEVANLADFRGYALVNADDPRIMVSAFQYCRTGTGWAATVLSQTSIPVYPVGATIEYFQAGMPSTWTPPMATPAVPE